MTIMIIILLVWLGLSVWLSLAFSEPHWGPADQAVSSLMTSLVVGVVMLGIALIIGWIIQAFQ